MEYGPSDSSGTDDDLPPTHQNRGIRAGRVIGNGRAIGGAIAHPRVQGDMEIQIHRLEQEAYCSVLRAFKAQADAITWEKEGLMTELRKELRVSDEEHRELLNQVNADDIIRRIREWRQSGGVQTGIVTSAQPDVAVPSPSVSASRKRQKTSQSIQSLGAPSPVMHSQSVAPPLQPTSSTVKRLPASGPKGKKPKPTQTLPGASAVKQIQHPSGGQSGRGQVGNKNASGVHVPTEPAAFDPLVGRKVLTRWPEDNNFYEAIITDYNAAEGLHALVYDINTNNETWEWVNLKEISPEDIRWEGEDPGINNRTGRGPPGRGVKRPNGRGGAIPGAGRGRGTMKNQAKKDFPPSQNGVGKKNNGDIEILHTETLLKEVEKVFNAGHPDPLEVEKAKKALRDHEQSLIDAIARLAEASDGESEDGEHQYSRGQSMERDRGWRSRQYGGNQHGANYGNDLAGEGREGSEGDRMHGDRITSDYHHDGGDDM